MCASTDSSAITPVGPKPMSVLPFCSPASSFTPDFAPHWTAIGIENRRAAERHKPRC